MTRTVGPGTRVRGWDDEGSWPRRGGAELILDFGWVYKFLMVHETLKLGFVDSWNMLKLWIFETYKWNMYIYIYWNWCESWWNLQVDFHPDLGFSYQQISNQRHLLCTKQWVCPRIIPQITISGKDMERWWSVITWYHMIFGGFRNIFRQTRNWYRTWGSQCQTQWCSDQYTPTQLRICVYVLYHVWLPSGKRT